MLSRLLTKSRLADARTCQRLHHMKYELGYRPKTRVRALEFGSSTGAGLDAIWEGRQLVIPDLPLDATDEDRYERGKLSAMLLGYQARWAAEDREKYELLGVEVEFSCQLVNPATGRRSETWKLGGKLDKLVRERATGEVWIVEHKSSSEDISAGSAYWSKLRMDTQVSIYFVGGTALGHDVRGVLYNVLGKPKLQPSSVPLLDADGVKQVVDATGQRVRTRDGKKWRETGDTAQGFTLLSRPETPAEYEARCVSAIAENPDRYYRRSPVVRLEAEVSDALVDIWQQGQQMREAERLGRSPRNPEACSRWGRMCEFFPVCSGEATLQDETLYRLSSNVHPELTGPLAPKEGAEVADASTAAAAEASSTSPDTSPSTSGAEAGVKDDPVGGDQGQAAAPGEGDAVRTGGDR